VLNLTPAAFWAATPKELAMAARAFEGDITAPPERQRLEHLMSLYPDS